LPKMVVEVPHPCCVGAATGHKRVPRRGAERVPGGWVLSSIRTQQPTSKTNRIPVASQLSLGHDTQDQQLHFKPRNEYIGGHAFMKSSARYQRARTMRNLKEIQRHNEGDNIVDHNSRRGRRARTGEKRAPARTQRRQRTAHKRA
jgi:hypothetical protein